MATTYLYLALILGLYVFTKHFLRKTRNLPPSPFLTLPILGHLYLFKTPFHRNLIKVSARYGPVILLHLGARPVVVVSSQSTIEECLTKNDIIFANRPNLLSGKHLGQNYTTMSWSSYGHNWRNLRRIASIEVLSSHRVQMLSGIRADELRALLRRLSRNPGPGGEYGQLVDMKSVFYELMLNVMMMMIAGKRYYGVDVEDVEVARRFRGIVSETFEVVGLSDIGDFVPALEWFGARALEKRMIALQKNRDGFMQDLIEETRGKMRSGHHRDHSDEAGEKKKTMIEVLLSLQESEPEYYKDGMIRGIMMVLIAAGTDTSVGTMEWAFSLMLNNPQVLKKAQIEIDELVGQHRLVEESDIPNLRYLRCILYEAMRIYPPGPLLVPHESSEECTVGGFRIPRGTMLLMNVWATQNDPKIWEEPSKFMPERFEGLEGPRDGGKFLPFGSGRRSCPGEGLALRIMVLGLGSLLQCFDWERVSEEMVDMTEGPQITIPKAQPLVAKCKTRPAMANLLSQL